MRCSADRWSVTICSSFDSSKHCLVLCQARYHTAPAAWCHYHQVTSPRGTAKWDPDLYWDKNNFSRGSGGIELYLLKSTLGMPKTFISMCGLLKKQKQKSNSSRSQLNMQQTNTDVSKKMKLIRKKTSLWDSYFLHLKAHFFKLLSHHISPYFFFYSPNTPEASSSLPSISHSWVNWRTRDILILKKIKHVGPVGGSLQGCHYVFSNQYI